MNSTAQQLASVSSDDLTAVVQQVWSSFLDVDLAVAPADTTALPAPALSAVVHISGAWEGAVRLECRPSHAAAAAALMFAIEPSDASDEASCDALGELANIVTGNVKSLLPAPSALSLPSVSSTDGSAPPTSPRAVLVRRVAFVAPTGALHVTVWAAGAP